MTVGEYMYDLESLIDKVSPMMKLYISTKLKYKDCILFYRLGDFYEMFFDDALKTSEILDLTLTGKECGMSERAPMCGIPFHAAEQYIAKLVAAGEKVAVCEQLDAPQKGKLVTRDVTRVVTAGTVTEDANLEVDKNNFIACVKLGKNSGAIAWCDITTGLFYARKCNDEDFIAEINDVLVRISPAELISDEEFYLKTVNTPLIVHGILPKPSFTDGATYLRKNAEKLLKEQFGVVSLAAFEIADDEELICVCGALVAYLRETQKHALVNINKISVEKKEQCMTLDYNSLKNLELVKNLRDGKRYGTLLWLLDKTDTAMGSRLLVEWISAPLISEEKINYRLNGVEELFNSAVLRSGLDEGLKNVRDMERLSGRISNGNVTPADCTALAASMKALPSLKMLLFGTTSKILKDVDANIDDFSELAALISKAINDDPTTYGKSGNYICENFDPELDRLRNLRKNSGDVIRQIEAKERDATGIKTLKIVNNKVFGYSIEVTNSFKDKVPYYFIRKQTLTTGERYITEELKKVEEEILTADESIKRIETEIFTKIKTVLSENIKRIQRTARAVACLDVLVSFAKVSRKYNYCKPEVTAKRSAMNVVAGRHPVIEAMSNETFVSNDTYIYE